MKKYISNFHFITHDIPGKSHLEQVQMACEAGANWIQYRCLTKNERDLIAEINEIEKICDDWGATLILTDHCSLLSMVDAQGIHIEDMKADFKAIRERIGETKTLGASANTFEDIQRIVDSGVVDYIGCGPLSDTQTKPNNYSQLGIEGYRRIVEAMEKKGISIPVLAVGGVSLDDVEELVKANIFGIGVSGAVNFAENPASAIKEFRRKLS